MCFNLNLTGLQCWTAGGRRRVSIVSKSDSPERFLWPSSYCYDMSPLPLFSSYYSSCQHLVFCEWECLYVGTRMSPFSELIWGIELRGHLRLVAHKRSHTIYNTVHKVVPNDNDFAYISDLNGPTVLQYEDIWIISANLTHKFLVFFIDIKVSPARCSDRSLSMGGESCCHFRSYFMGTRLKITFYFSGHCKWI